MNQRGARFFLIGFALLSLLTLIQQLFHPMKLAGLQGAFDAGARPEFSTDQWLKGRYQQQCDHYLKYNTAFNGELVRLRNQADYSIFGKINTVLTLGKENYIFDPNYAAALTGSDWLTDSLRNDKVRAVESTLRLLDAIHVPVYVCFAPNKVHYYSEFFPEPVTESTKTNRNFFDSLLSRNRVPVIDYDAWFLQMKDTSAYPLVPKYGAHWTTYGAYLAADTLFTLLYAGRRDQYASFSMDRIEWSDNSRFTDDDYLASLNLMIKWKSPRMAYPRLEFTEGEKPAALIISDSFIWNFYDLGIIQNCFSEVSQVRYYNKSVYDIHKNNLGPVGGLDLGILKKCDFIIIVTSDPSLKDFGFGFFESASKLTGHE